ncbi:MAG: class I SAM-dependent methyltransferase [Alphaproteobacteria bacterium]|nr:class I SAM-dependent methyltransferase [Alphaproteobacteria bacterium]MBF0250511.1 class I SAM-dependent methyltransferase [Alphaproteobacteria bacterium]
MVSYPYEWGFSALKAAALLHLDVHLAALGHGMTLSDASAYNVQFMGARPVFIDHLSFIAYQDGAIWGGYRQFCEQFLYPLLLRAYAGVAHNGLYRGRLEGVGAEDLLKILPAWRKWTPKVFVHGVLHAALAGKGEAIVAGDAEAKTLAQAKFPKAALARLLEKLRAWIAGLEPRGRKATFWRDYERFKSYSDAETRTKRALVHDFARAHAPGMVWDLGCNQGEFSFAALDGGAGAVVGWEFDQDALDGAFHRAALAGAAFTPLFGDVTNPSPAQGWNQRERMGWAERGPVDAVLALAVIHHLIIGRNVPMAAVADYLTSLAPRGVVEIPPLGDVQVRRMLRLRAAGTQDYDPDGFVRLVQERARILNRRELSPGGRVLIEYHVGG